MEIPRKVFLWLIVIAVSLTLSCEESPFLTLKKEKDQQKRLLKKEFNRCAWSNFGTSLVRLAVYLENVDAKSDWYLQAKMPTWSRLIFDLYADPTLAQEEQYIYASKLLRKNLKSRIWMKSMASVYLSCLKPDTSEVRCIEEYANQQTDEEKKGYLLFIAKLTKIRFYEMQYGLKGVIGLFVFVPQIDFLESPPMADSYIPIFIGNDSLLTIDDFQLLTTQIPIIIERKVEVSKSEKCCIIFLADRDVKWGFIQEILQSIMELSRKKDVDFEFFFKAEAFPLTESEPNKLGLSFQPKNKPLESIDIEMHMDEKGNLLASGKKQNLWHLENLPPNKNISFVFSKEAKLQYILRVLSFVKKSNPNDYDCVAK